MASELQDAWQRLSLTEEEETVVICEDDTPSERAEQVALCLLGKLHTVNTFNIGAMKTVLKTVWKPTKGVIIKELDWNLFVFQFFAKADKEYVFNEGLWAFDGCILMLTEMTGLEQPSEVVFNKVRFCIKVYDVPALKQTYNFAKFLGSQVGDFVDCVDESLCGVEKSLNFRADVDVYKPLRRGVKTVLCGKTIWIRLKYVKLPDFCYACGKLSHSYKSCEQFAEGMVEEDLQYGSWLRASPLKSRRRNAEVELQEERRLILAYKNKKEGSAVRTKLFFSNHMNEAVQSEGGELANMMIDGGAAITPSGEVFKRKLIETSLKGELEKIRVVEGKMKGSAESSKWAEVAVQPRQAQ